MSENNGGEIENIDYPVMPWWVCLVFFSTLFAMLTMSGSVATLIPIFFINNSGIATNQINYEFSIVGGLFFASVSIFYMIKYATSIDTISDIKVKSKPEEDKGESSGDDQDQDEGR